MLNVRLTALSLVWAYALLVTGCDGEKNAAQQGPEEPKSVAGQATPADAFKKAFASLRNGDKRGFIESVHVTKATAPSIEAIGELAEARAEFERAFKKRFGETEWKQAGIKPLSGGLDERAIDRLFGELELKIDGDLASMSTGDRSEPLRFFREDDAWKVDGWGVIGMMQSRHISNLAEVTQAAATVTRRTTTEISNPHATAAGVLKKMREDLRNTSPAARLREEYMLPKARPKKR